MLADLFNQNRLYFLSLAIFIAIIAWVYRPGARKRYEADGRIPFDEKTATSSTPVK